MDPDAYLRRVQCPERSDPSIETLARLHRAHLHTVPFENLDIPLGRSISLSPTAMFEKIVSRRRGGFCYELNGLFAWLLQEIGFRVEMLSGRVFDGGQPGPEFDHMALLVDVGVPVIADVGFGDCFLEPLPLDSQERFQDGHWYRFVAGEGNWTLERRKPDSDWEPQYRFTLQPRQLAEFEPMCHYQQTSPDSVFTRKSVCSLATPEGRISLSNGRLIVTTQGGREERRITSEAEYRELLERHFGMELAAEAELGRLLAPPV